MQGDKHLTWGQVRKELTKPIDHGVAGARSAVSDIMSGKARKDLTKGIGDGVAGVRSAVSDVMSGKARKDLTKGFSDIMSGKKVPDEEVPEIDAGKASDLAFQSVLDTFSDLSGKTDKTKNEDRTNREKLLAKYYDPNTGKAATDAIAKLDQFKNSLGNTSPTDSKTQGSRAELPQQLGGLLDTASKMIEDRPKEKKYSWGELAGFGSKADKSGSKTRAGGETKASPNRGQVDSAIKESSSDNTEKKSPKGNDQE